MLHFLVNPFLFQHEVLIGQLHDRMVRDLVLRSLSPATACHYLLGGSKFATFFGRSPAELGEAEIRQFLLHCIEVQEDCYRSRACQLMLSASARCDGFGSLAAGKGRGGGRGNNGVVRGINRNPSQFFHKTFLQTGKQSRERALFDKYHVRTPSGTRAFFVNRSQIVVTPTFTKA